MPGSVLTTDNAEDQVLTPRDIFPTVHSGDKVEVRVFVTALANISPGSL